MNRTGSTLQLLEKLKAETPETWVQTLAIGRWAWLEFRIPLAREVRGKPKDPGFRRNRGCRPRPLPSGAHRTRSPRGPRVRYPVTLAGGLELNETPPARRSVIAKEFKIVALRECPLPDDLQICDTPEKAADYWRLHVTTIPYFNPEVECFVVLMLNTRRRVKGHQLLTIGTLDTILVHPREVFRAAVIAAAAAIVMMHNHPSGEPTPSEGDIKVTRDLIRAGQLLKIEVLDHVIVGRDRHCSLREMGYFHQ